MMLFRSVLVFLAAVSLSGCGYRAIGASGSGDPAATVRVPVFANRSFRPVVDALVTNAVIREISTRGGGWRVGGEGADYLLSGTVLSYASQAVAYTNADVIAGYRSTLSVELVLRRESSGEIVWKRTITESQDYRANDVLAYQQNSEDAAIADLCARIGREAAILLLGNF